MAPHSMEGGGMRIEWYDWISVCNGDVIKKHVVPTTEFEPTHRNNILTYEKKSIPRNLPLPTISLLQKYTPCYEISLKSLIRSFGIRAKRIVELFSEMRLYKRNISPIITGTPWLATHGYRPIYVTFAPAYGPLHSSWHLVKGLWLENYTCMRHTHTKYIVLLALCDTNNKKYTSLVTDDQDGNRVWRQTPVPPLTTKLSSWYILRFLCRHLHWNPRVIMNMILRV